MKRTLVNAAESLETLRPKPVGIALRFLCVPILLIIMVAAKAPALCVWAALGDKANS